jgi:hypothetical protein
MSTTTSATVSALPLRQFDAASIQQAYELLISASIYTLERADPDAWEILCGLRGELINAGATSTPQDHHEALSDRHRYIADLERRTV